MNKKNKIAVLLFVSLCIVGVCLYYTIIERGDIDILEATAEMHTNSELLVDLYSKDEDKANSHYKNKIIEVTGIVKEISFLNNRNTILLKGNTTKSSVICDMQLNQTTILRKLKKNDIVKIKGVCKGYLKDVILLNCTFINQNTNE